MSTYFIKGKGWRYDFILNGVRHTRAWYKTKTMAKQAESDKRKEVEKGTPTAMGFLELVNRRLDHMHVYNSKAHYDDFRYRCKPWVQLWGNLDISAVTPELIRGYILDRRRVSAFTANRDVVSLRSLFNFGRRHSLCKANPAESIDFLPVEKKVKYIPPLEDIFKVIAAADPDTQDYLWAIRETMARVGEVSRMQWDAVDLEERSLILYTRKKRGGDLTPRKVPLTDRLHKILSRRSRSMQWVFWHMHKGQPRPWGKRNRLVPGLCKKAGVRHFTFHSIRHSGASVLDNLGVPIGTIQRLLGHSNRKTTEIYLQSIGESERQAMEIFEEASNHTQSLTQPNPERVGR